MTPVCPGLILELGTLNGRCLAVCSGRELFCGKYKLIVEWRTLERLQAWTWTEELMIAQRALMMGKSLPNSMLKMWYPRNWSTMVTVLYSRNEFFCILKSSRKQKTQRQEKGSICNCFFWTHNIHHWDKNCKWESRSTNLSASWPLYALHAETWSPSSRGS